MSLYSTHSLTDQSAYPQINTSIQGTGIHNVMLSEKLWLLVKGGFKAAETNGYHRLATLTWF